MKKQITFLLLFCSKLLFSQEESKEEFFNQVYKDFIPEDYEYFYLEPPYIHSLLESLCMVPAPRIVRSLVRVQLGPRQLWRETMKKFLFVLTAAAVGYVAWIEIQKKG